MSPWLWSLPVILVATLLAIFTPLFRRAGNRPLPVGLEGDPRFELEDQRDLLLRELKELEYDQTSGVITVQEATASRAELEGQLAPVLERLDQAPASAPGSGLAAPASLLTAKVLLILLVTLGTIGLYGVMGTPADVPPTREEANDPQMEQVAQQVEMLAQRLQNEPDNLEKWGMLARSYLVMGRLREAIDAYVHILNRDPEHLEAAAGLAMAQMQSDDPALYPLGVQMFEGVLKKDPTHLEALWFLGVDAYRRGDGIMARDYWQRLIVTLPAESPHRPRVEQALEQAKVMVQGGKAP